MEFYLQKRLVCGHGRYAVDLKIIVYIARGELLYQNDEDARRKFENYSLMDTNRGVLRAVLEPYINRNIYQAKI